MLLSVFLTETSFIVLLLPGKGISVFNFLHSFDQMLLLIYRYGKKTEIVLNLAFPNLICNRT